MLLAFFFLGAAFLCAIFAAFVWPTPPPSRPHVGWLAFAFYMAYLLVSVWK
jgi:hypothetical protein